MPTLSSPAELENYRKDLQSKLDENRPCIAVCGGTGCHSLGNQAIISALGKEIARRKLKTRVDVRETGCPGFCEKGPIVIIYPEGICYVQVKPEDTADIISETIVGKKVIDRLVYTDPKTGQKAIHENEIPFYRNQMRLLIADNSKIDPKSIDDYIAIGGYSAFAKALSISPQQVIAEMKDSGLRGRSGSGFPVGRKWEAAMMAEGETKYLIVNCHEGDPGSFSDRRVLESNPHRIIEGLLIGARTVRATDGFIFVGNEFPITVENAETAIRQAEELGLLGENILGSGLNFNVSMRIDAGGYVCGESTALRAAIEGRAGEANTKYDHDTERGLFDKPTILNNLQSWANAPIIINRGAAAFSAIGTPNSKGTRVFSLVGAVNNSGLVEVPMGKTLREIIFDIGGGIRDDKKFKSVLIGGPLGAFLPESMLDVPVDFNEFVKVGGSLGPSLIVFDENTCMVDMTKYFIAFLANESCGKCTPCREGLRQMLKILNRITEGNGREGDIAMLETIAATQREAALCALGQTASQPLMSALRHFRNEFDVHVKEKRCPASVCRILTAALPK